MINMPGGPEIMVILLLALLVLGPEQLPKAMRTFGNVMSEIRKVSSSFQAEMKSAMDVIESSGTDKASDGAAGTNATGASSAPSTAAIEATASEPDGGTGDQAGSTPVVDEVRARNDGTPQASSSADAGEAVPGTAPSEEPTKPKIDPADRAAG